MIERRLVGRQVTTLGTIPAPFRTAVDGPPLIYNGLVAYWDIGNPYSYGGSGATVTNLISGGDSASLANTPTYTGEYGGAISIDGTNEYIDMPTFSNTQAESIIVIGRSNVSPWSMLTFFSCDRGKNGHVMSPEAPTTDFRYYIFDNAATPNAYAIGTAFAVSDITKPHFYAITTNGSNDHRGFLDGVLVRNMTTSITRGASESSTRWNVGFDDVSVSPARYGNATYYAILRYNRQLTDSEMFEVYQHFRGRFRI